jgi:GH15 family glucan-1,4-alpha-glucosidase
MTTLTQGERLARRSVEVLLEGQSAGGALVASPAFPVYRYAWLRDGAFCAHALDLVGEHAAARAFHAWAGRSVEAHRTLFEDAIASVQAGASPPPEAMPPTRYTLEGTLERADDEPWPNFQLDGYGTWLWALDQHLAGRAAPETLAPAVELVARYLQATWRLKCFDCWEEFGGGEHASTLGAVVAGLDGASRLLGEPAWRAAADRVRDDLLERFTVSGRFRRGADDDRVDGSLLWLGVPFGVLEPDHPTLRATVDAVRRDLTGPGGGLYRYRGDTYYGGGQWLLLTSSLAWHDASTGNHDAAAAGRAWVRAQATADGDLPEQVDAHAQDPAMVEPWRRRWGPVATPLLWSHAMYLIAERTAR